MRLREIPFTALDDYPEQDVPSALYAPACRLLFNVRHGLEDIENVSFSLADEAGKTLGWCLLAADWSGGKVKPLLWGVGVPALFWPAKNLSPEEALAVNEAAKKCIQTRLKRFPEAALSVNDLFCSGTMAPLAQETLLRPDGSASLSFRHCVDLSLSSDSLRAALRRRYKATINKGLKTFSFRTATRENASEKDIEQLHACHVSASGRDIYPQSFWDACFEIIDKGKGYLTLAEQEGKVCGASFQITCDKLVYYSIGAFDRTLQDSGLSHACLWFAIMYAKEKGFAVFETGQTFFEACSKDMTEKELSICFFKRGFGGSNLPMLTVSKKLT